VENRKSALLRLSELTLLRLISGLLLVLVPVLFVQNALHLLFTDTHSLGRAFSSIPIALTALGSYGLYVRIIERRSVAELDTAGAAREGLVGFGLGAILFSVTIGVISVLGSFTVDGFNPMTSLVPALAVAVVSGVVEEILFRGLFFRLLEEWAGSWLSLIFSAALFGALHFQAPHASVFTAIAIALEAGLMLALAFMLTRRLWLCMGLHMAWNFTQAGIFGVAVSGHDVGGLLKTHASGPELISGGPFGAEASVVAVFFCLLFAAGFLRLVLRAKTIVSPSWRRKTKGPASSPQT
jgi:uncharacterized protein